ncbi:hypothetical protein TUM12370_16920 [Salmonella enterica subsp. enterica serovar Choleraesuis]|nr:hypothetical protein TUM12370_16920 [Salmonella enterica subsp. enterica serovar Choleraesuis]
MRKYRIYYSFQDQELAVEEEFNGTLDANCVEALQFARENSSYVYQPGKPLTEVVVTRVVETQA